MAGVHSPAAGAVPGDRGQRSLEWEGSRRGNGAGLLSDPGIARLLEGFFSEVHPS